MPPITVTAVAYGRPAARALRDAVAEAKAGDPLAPVTVVVPSNHVGVTVRRLLGSDALGPVTAQGRGLAAVSFLTPYRLAELLGAAALAAEGRRPVSTPVLAAAARRVLAADPGVFGPVAAHPATEAALVASYRELRDLPAPALDRLAARSARAADVVRIHRSVRAALRQEWSDEEDLMAAAAARVADGAPLDLGTVVVHLPQVVGLHAGRLLAALAERTPVVVLAGLTGDARADAEVHRSLLRMGAPALADGPPPPADAAPPRTAIASASDPEDEVRHAVRRVVDAVAAGTPLDRIALLHPAMAPYPTLVHEHLEGAGIARNGTTPVPLAGRVAGRVLLGLLALPHEDWSRQAVMAWLTTAPILWQGRTVPTSRWERITRRAGVVRGPDQWDQRLAAYAEERDAGADEARREGDDEAAERRAADAEQARQLRAFVLALVADLARAGTRPRRWGQHRDWARRRLTTLLGRPDRRGHWPADGVERRAAEAVDTALDRLGALDAVEGEVGLDVFTRTLEVELDGDSGRVGRLGEGLLVGGISLGVGLDLDLVVVVGLAEGLAPLALRDDSLLPDHERSVLGGDLALRREATGRQHRELAAGLASAPERAISYPRGDLRGSKERVASRWLLAEAARLDGTGPLWSDDLARTAAPWFHEARSFDHGLRSLTRPATAQEHRLRSLLATDAADRPALDVVRALGDGPLTAGAEMVVGRRSSRFTRYDGNLAGLALPSPADATLDRPTSATRLERFARCPFDYFVRSVLGVQELENPEDSDTITPINRGQLVHQVLEAFVLEVLARPAEQRPGPFDRWTAADRARAREIAEEVCDRYQAQGLTGRTLYWTRDRARILADIDRTLTMDEVQRAAHGARHLHAELAFGRDGELPPVALDLPDGRQVRFAGMVDRIDVVDGDGDGAGIDLVVADYKTGSPTSFASLSAADPDQGGTHLQLVVYAAAARLAAGDPDATVRSEYWFTSTRGKFATKGYEVTPEIGARVGESLGLIVRGIESGAFPLHPPERTGSPFNPCWSCDPDFLGVTDLLRTWEAMADEPGLATYRELIDPERGAPADEDAHLGSDPK